MQMLRMCGHSLVNSVDGRTIFISYFIPMSQGEKHRGRGSRFNSVVSVMTDRGRAIIHP